MKKVIFAAIAAVVALSAAAQNRSIDLLAQKYTDTEGYTVVNLTDEAVQSILGMMPAENFGEANVTLDDGTVFTLADMLRDISVVTAVILDRKDEKFAAEVRSAVKSGNYSTVASVNSDKVKVQVLAADVKRGKLRGKRELVLTVQDDKKMILGRIVGQLDVELLAKVAGEILNK